MQVEVKVPQLSESVSEATLVAWRKKAGEAVKRDEGHGQVVRQACRGGRVERELVVEQRGERRVRGAGWPHACRVSGPFDTPATALTSEADSGAPPSPVGFTRIGGKNYHRPSRARNDGSCVPVRP